MTAVGIICEYNPLHLGHVRQLETVRRTLGPDTAIICLMSGNYVQRGEPAIFDKFVRARAAVESGADLVLELPLTAAIQSAEGFAQRGVQILSRVGAQALCFGCECADRDALMRAAAVMELPEFPGKLRAELASGVSYAEAKQRAAAALGADGSVLERPNDILALEYCRAILRFAPQMRPLAIHRPGDYHDPSENIEAPSAASVRRLLLEGGSWQPFIPEPLHALYAASLPHAPAFGERAMLARLRAMTPEDWRRTPYTSEGLWSKAYRAAQSAQSVDDFCGAVRSRRYPMTRVRRMALCAYLGIDAQLLAAEPPYVRVLAFDAAGRAILRAARKRGEIALVNAGARPENTEYAALERRADGLYTLFLPPDVTPEAGAAQKGRIYQKKK